MMRLTATGSYRISTGFPAMTPLLYHSFSPQETKTLRNGIVSQGWVYASSSSAQLSMGVSAKVWISSQRALELWS